MNEQMHQPYSDWLLADEPLNVEQTHQLQEHLRQCESCRQRQLAWNSVNQLFRTSGPVGPAPGFAFRWQVRLVTRRIEQQRRIAWIFFAVMIGLSAFLLGLMAWQLLAASAGPQQALAFLMVSYTSLGGFTHTIFQLLTSFRELVPSFSLLGMTFFLGFVSMLSVLWLVVYRQLTMQKVDA